MSERQKKYDGSFVTGRSGRADELEDHDREDTLDPWGACRLASCRAAIAPATEAIHGVRLHPR